MEEFHTTGDFSEGEESLSIGDTILGLTYAFSNTRLGLWLDHRESFLLEEYVHRISMLHKTKSERPTFRWQGENIPDGLVAFGNWLREDDLFKGRDLRLIEVDTGSDFYLAFPCPAVGVHLAIDTLGELGITGKLVLGPTPLPPLRDLRTEIANHLTEKHGFQKTVTESPFPQLERIKTELHSMVTPQNGLSAVVWGEHDGFATLQLGLIRRDITDLAAELFTSKPLFGIKTVRNPKPCIEDHNFNCSDQCENHTPIFFEKGGPGWNYMDDLASEVEAWIDNSIPQFLASARELELVESTLQLFQASITGERPASLPFANRLLNGSVDNDDAWFSHATDEQAEVVRSWIEAHPDGIERT